MQPARPSVQPISTTEMLGVLRSHPHLLANMHYPSFFCSPDWLEAVLKASRPIMPFALLALRGDEPIAVLPLERVRNWLGGTDLRFLGYRYHPDPLGVIANELDMSAAIRAIVAYMRGQREWDRLILDYVLEDEARFWTERCVPRSVAPYLDLPSKFDEILSEFDRKKRYKIRRKIRVAKDAGFDLHIASDSSEKTTLLQEMFTLHARRSEETGRKSSIAAEDVVRLHMHLVKGSVHPMLFSLQMQEKVIAVIYGFQYHKRFFFYQITHNPDFAHLRPGSVLLTHVIE
jgi:CelD/BcsL family acetyltransferase involved in cellulose biosynthesis